MKPAHRPLAFIAVVFLAMAAIVTVSRLRAGNDIIPWRTNFSAAQSESRASGKPVFAYFTADWCGPCQSLKHTTWSDKQVAKTLEQFVPVKIDIDANQDLAQRYSITAVPTFAILSADGSVVSQSEGALGPDDLIRWIRQRR